MVNNYFGIYVQALLAKNTTTTLQKQLGAIKDLQIKVTPTFGKINKTQLAQVNKDLQNQLLSTLKDSGQIDITPKTNNESLTKTKKAISEVGSAINSNLTPSLANSGKEMSAFGNSITRATGTLDSMLGIVGKVAIWGFATNAVYGTKRALEEMFQSYVAIEDELISIQRVTTNFDMNKIFTGSYDAAQKYGAGLMDMLSSVEEIARSYGGLTEEEVLATAQAGILASTIADMDSTDAVQGIIAVSNAYKLAVEDGQLLIDMANEVDNNYSVTSADIITAWEKSSATAKTFGVDIQNLTGYIAAISTTTQESGSVIGNALKTIFSRITTMGSASSAIEKVGVDIFDPITKESRNVQDILADLAGKWDKLTSTQQENLGVSVAGRHQLTRFLALMNGWNVAVDATTTALNSEGSAERENAVYLESYTAKLKQLENAQLQLSETINGSNISVFGKSLIDLKIGIKELENSYFSAHSAITVFIGSLAVLIGFLAKTANGQKLLNSVVMFFTTEEKAAAIVTDIRTKGLIKNRAGLVLATVAENLKAKATRLSAQADAAAAFNAKATSIAFTVQAGTATVAAGAVSLLSKALLTVPGLLVVSTLALLVGQLVKSANAAKEAEKALSAEATTISNNKAMVTEYVEKLKGLIELKKQLNQVEYDNTYGEDESKYLDALAEKYTEISDELKSQNNSLEYKLSLIDKENIKLAEQKKKEYESSKKTNLGEPAIASSQSKGFTGISGNQGFSSVSMLNDDLDNSIDKFEKFKVASINAYKATYEKGQEYYRLTGDITTAENDNINKVKEAGIERAKSKEDLDTLTSILENIQEAYKGTEDKGITPYTDALKELGYTTEEITVLLNGTVDSASSATADLALYKNAIEDATTGLTEFNQNQTNAIDLFFGVGDGTTDAISSMMSYIEMFGNGSAITKEAADSLADSFTFLGEKVFDSGDQLLNNVNTLKMVSETLSIAKSDEEAYADAVASGTVYVAKGYEAGFESMRDAKVSQLQMELDALVAQKAIWQQVVDGQATLQEAENAVVNNNAQAVVKKTANNKTYLEKYKLFVGAIIGSQEAIKSAESGDIETAKTKINAINTNITAVTETINKWKTFKIVGTTASAFKKQTDAARKASESTINYYDLAEKALLQYKNSVESINSELDVLQETNKQLAEGSQEWFNNLAQQQAVIERNKIAIQQYIEQVRIQLRNNNLDAESKTKLINVIENLNLEYAKLNSSLVDITNTEKKYYQSQIENKLELIKNLEEDRHDKALANIKAEREAFQNQIDEQLALMKKASDARTYEQDLNKLQEQRLNILTQISRLEGDNSRLAKSKVLDLKTQLSDVETEIGNLNYDRGSSLREGALNDLSDTLDNYYDNLEQGENDKNKLILSSLDDAKNSVDTLSMSLEGLKGELGKWGNTLSSFSTWAQTFDNLIGTMPSSNIVSSSIPVNNADNSGNTTTATQITFQITGSTKDAQNIASSVIDNLIKAGLINSGN